MSDETQTEIFHLLDVLAVEFAACCNDTAKLSAKIDVIDAKVMSLDAKVESLDRCLGGVETRVESIETEVRALRGEFERRV